jgi:hypothetical protein
MQERLEVRLDKLRGEYEAGQKMLAELETRQFELRQTLLRIIGAIQVLEEILAEAEAVSGDMSSDALARSDNGSNDARS